MPGQAVLRVFVDDAAPSGGAIHLANANWDESTITWNSAPAVTGGPIATAGEAVKGQWVEFDVTAAINGSGTYSFALLPTSTNTLKYTSSEGGPAPELVIRSAP